MERKKISVVMAVYNGEKYIEEQVCSILEQSRKPDEFIVVDDKSSDSSIEILKKCLLKYEFTNYKIIKNYSNKGFIKSFLAGINETSGEYIFLSDQDDIWFKNKIQDIIDIFETRNDMLSVCSSFLLVDDNGKSIKVKQLPYRANNNILKFKVKKDDSIKVNLRKVIENNISPGCTCAFRKQIKEYVKNVCLKTLILPHDWMINICAASHGGLYFYNKRLVKYRQHSNNTIGLKKINQKDKRIKNYYNLIEQKKNIRSIIINLQNSEDMINVCDNIIKSYSERIEALNTGKVTQWVRSFLKAVFSYKICSDNYYMDLIIILKEKLQ